MLGGEESGRHRGIDVDDRDRGARLEHRGKRGLAPTPAPIPRRRRYADDRSPHQAGNDRRERALPAGEDEVDLRGMPFDTAKGSKQAMQSGDPDVVGADDPDSELPEQGARLIGVGDIARSRRQDRDRPPSIPDAQGPVEAQQAAAGQGAKREAAGDLRVEPPLLRGGRPGDQSPDPVPMKGP
jgi:hypothetical protein